MSEIISDTSDPPINPLDNIQNQTFTSTMKIIISSWRNWLSNLEIVTNVLISDIKTLWVITSGSNLHRTKVIGRFIFYYLIIIALWIIEKGFWLNQQIFKATYSVILRTVQSNQITAPTATALFILAGVILLGFLLGATITSSACDD